MDYRQVFSMLVAFAVVVLLIVTSSNLLESVVKEASVTGEQVFRTQKYMAGTVNIYSRGEDFGVYELGNSKWKICQEDSEVLENHQLGFSIPSEVQGDVRDIDCHSDAVRYMSVAILNRVDTGSGPETEVETLEVGER